MLLTLSREALKQTAHAASSVAVKGLPAIRAALYGARLGAGKALDASVLERLGVTVARAALPTANTVGVIGTTARAGIEPVGAALGVALHAKDGVALRLGAGGSIRAVASEGAVVAARGLTARGALAGIGRAATHGAIAGAIVDGAFAAIEAGAAVRSGAMSLEQAAIHTGTCTARGAVAGAAGVAAAGAAAALIAATGVAVAGAPVVVPIVAMMATGTLVSRKFDRMLAKRRATHTPAALGEPSS